MERPQRGETNVRHGVLFWKCENYEAYAIACDMEGLTPIWDRDAFEDLKTYTASIVKAIK